MPALWLNGHNYTGGGGNANEQVLTWAEYCALTPEEKMNGTTYYITDINGDGQSFQPVIFSLEEREIGVFMDGKPLYEKTVTFTNVSRTGVIDLDLINVDNIFVHGGSYGGGRPIPYVHNDMANGIGGFFDTDSNGKWIWNVRGGGAAQSVAGWITVRYTKTTDQPGSGIWTPQGVPAVHYDGNEKVVGTWFGETLYEKTIIVSNFNASTSDSGWYYGTLNLSDYSITPSQVFPLGSETFITLQDTTTRPSVFVDWQGGSYVYVYFLGSRSGTLTLTIRYTKTTS